MFRSVNQRSYGIRLWLLSLFWNFHLCGVLLFLLLVVMMMFLFGVQDRFHLRQWSCILPLLLSIFVAGAASFIIGAFIIGAFIIDVIVFVNNACTARIAQPWILNWTFAACFHIPSVGDIGRLCFEW